MPLLIIAGMPTSVLSRHKQYKPSISGWNIQLVASRDKRKSNLQTCWSQVLAKASGDVEGAHVFAYHYLEDEYPWFHSQMHDRHRLVWMARDTLGYYGSDTYTEVIEKFIDFECRWRAMLRPEGPDAAGLLPESAFSPIRCKDMWSRIRSVHPNRDDLKRISMLVRHFRDTHYGDGRWEDNRGMQFKVASARHGSHPPYGSFKFTYQLPEGFHYDVRRNVPNRTFIIRDTEGQSHQFRTYTNVDSHGSIRGGR